MPKPRFKHAVIVGKYQAHGIRAQLEEIAHFLVEHQLDVSFDRDTAQATGVSGFDALAKAEIGRRCDHHPVGPGRTGQLHSQKQLQQQAKEGK